MRVAVQARFNIFAMLEKPVKEDGLEMSGEKHLQEFIEGYRHGLEEKFHVMTGLVLLLYLESNFTGWLMDQHVPYGLTLASFSLSRISSELRQVACQPGRP